MNALCIKAIKEAISTMQKANEVIKEYCTNECEICPLKDMCDWEGNIDFLDSRINDSVLDKYIDLHTEWEYRNERKTFKEATGIDPAWYDFNNDRTERDI